jgi:hypothetical protein
MSELSCAMIEHCDCDPGIPPTDDLCKDGTLLSFPGYLVLSNAVMLTVS